MNPYVHQQVASNGGSISLNGLELLYFAGSVSAQAGGTTAIGGSLTIGSGLAAIFPDPTSGAPYPQAGLPGLFISPTVQFAPGNVTLGHALAAVPQEGGGYFGVDQFDSGGFGSLTLNAMLSSRRRHQHCRQPEGGHRPQQL